jgi:hypothetical protein
MIFCDMPERKWGQDVIDDLKQRFQEATGKPYNGAAFESPDGTPVAVRKIVAAIKVLEAGGGQLEIMAEVQRLPKGGDAHVVPKDKENLLDEHAKFAALAKLWSPYQ